MRTKFLDYDARRSPKTAFYCVRCQKDLRPGQPYRLVHLLDTMMVIHPADKLPSGNLDNDLGFLPVGNDCARRFGMEWTHPPKAI